MLSACHYVCQQWSLFTADTTSIPLPADTPIRLPVYCVSSIHWFRVCCREPQSLSSTVVRCQLQVW